MRTKPRLYAVLAAALLAVLILAGCDQLGLSKGSDAEVARDVQARIFADPAVTNKQLTIQSGNGVVTLSGTVSSDAERAAAAGDAAGVQGVKTVVNNLQVMAQAAPPAPIVAEAAPARVEPAPAPRRRTVAAAHRPAPRVRDYPNEPPAAPPAPVATATAASTVPPPPPEPVRITVPEGSTLSIRLIDSIDSEKNNPGDVFRATLETPVTVGDQIVIPADADIEGRVVESSQAGHYKGRSGLALELSRITYNGQSYALQTDQWSRQGSSRGARTAKTVGGGAALGAIIGGIAGGGKGAAIGAAAGAGAGAGVEAVTKPQVIKVSSETVLSFRLTSPVTVIPATSARHRSSQ